MQAESTSGSASDGGSGAPPVAAAAPDPALAQLQADQLAEEAAQRKGLLDVEPLAASAAAAAAAAPGGGAVASTDDGGEEEARLAAAIRRGGGVRGTSSTESGEAAEEEEGGDLAAGGQGGHNEEEAPYEPAVSLRAPPVSVVVGFGTLSERAEAGAAAAAAAAARRLGSGSGAGGEDDADALGAAAEAAFDSLHAAVGMPGLGALPGARAHAGSGVARVAAAVAREKDAERFRISAIFPGEALLLVGIATQVGMGGEKSRGDGVPVCERR